MDRCSGPDQCWRSADSRSLAASERSITDIELHADDVEQLGLPGHVDDVATSGRWRATLGLSRIRCEYRRRRGMTPPQVVDADLLALAEFARTAEPQGARLSFHSNETKTILIIELASAVPGRSVALADSIRAFRQEKGLKAEFIIINSTGIAASPRPL
jgi:hypothetical protein